MTDRARLVHELASAARADRPTGADRARIRSGLASRVAFAPDSGIRHADKAAATQPHAPAPLAQAAGALPPAAAAPVAAAGIGSAAAKSATVLAVGKIAAGAVAVAALSFASGYATGVHEASRPVPPVPTEAGVEPSLTSSAAPSPVPTIGFFPEPALEPTAAAPAPIESPLAPPRRPVPDQVSGPRSRSSEHPAVGLPSLADETALLAEAQTALRDGDAARALERLDALAARHPAGALAEERSAVRILALCATGRNAEARAEGGRFLAQSPSSVHADRVRASCAFAEPINQ